MVQRPDEAGKPAPPGMAQRQDRSRWYVRGALVAIVLVSALLRLHGLSFGLPAVNESDELMFELGAVKMLAGKTLNPGWFGHPATTTMYLLAVLDILVFGSGWALGTYTGPKDFAVTIYRDPGLVMMPHRLAMVAFGLATIAMTAKVAQRVWSQGGAPQQRRAWIAALAAAALLAVNPVHAAWSQVIRSDGMACLFLLLCINACFDVAERGKRKDWLRAAAWLALAIATKWPFALGALGIAGAALLRLRAGSAPRSTLVMLVATLMLTVIFLLVVSPYLLLDYPTVLANLAGEAQPHHLGATGGSPLENLFWYGRGALWSGVGTLGAVLVLTGMWAGRRNGLVLCVLLPVGAGFVAAFMLQHIVWERWTLPLMPILAVLAGGGVARLDGCLSTRLSPARAGIVSAAALLLAAAPLAWDSWGRGSERLNDTRQQAVRWAHAHIADGQSVLIEHFAFDMLDRDWHPVFPLGDIGCVDARLWLNGKVKYKAVQNGRGNRSNVDYGTLNPAVRATCRTDWAILSQADRYAAEAERFPAENAAYRELIARGEIVATFRPQARVSSGPVIRIVRLRR